MVLMAIVTILSLLGILSLNFDGIVGGIISGLFYGYIFIVLYSLFDMFRTESERGYNAQYQQAPMGKA